MVLVKSDSISQRFLSQDGIYIFSCFLWQTAHKPLDTNRRIPRTRPLLSFILHGTQLCQLKLISDQRIFCNHKMWTEKFHTQWTSSGSQVSKATMVSTFLSYTSFSHHNTCGQTPCQHNGTCQTGFTDKGYRCLCPPEYKGTNCEKRNGW